MWIAGPGIVGHIPYEIYDSAMVPDPKWLEILKASGWQTTAIAVASGLLIWLNSSGLLPVPLHEYILQAAIVAGLVSACLALASIGSALVRASELPRSSFQRWRSRRHAEQVFRDYLPHLTERERAIYAYLLEKNQKTFTADSTGGYASTLLGRGFIHITAQRGQQMEMDDVPMSVPDFVWTVLQEHKDQFPYTPDYGGDVGRRKVERHPWRKPWGA